MAKEFLYHKIYQQLKEDILQGRLPYGASLPSERELSESHGVWRTTVRQALDMLVADGLVKKRSGLGSIVVYGQPKTSSAASDPVIGFFIAGNMQDNLQSEQPYYSDLLYHLGDECKAHSCRFIFTTINTASDVEQLMHNRFALVVYLSHSNFEYLEILKTHRIPTMLLNECYQDYPVLANDQFSAGYMAMKHLLDMGHEKVGIIAGPSAHYTMRRRLAGCCLALCEHGLPFVPREWYFEGPWEYETGYEGAKQIFTNRMRSQAPTALLAFNDIMAIGAIRALQEMSFHVPQDVSIIGSDNIRQLAFTEYGLTTVDMNTRYLAKVIVACAIKNVGTDFPFGTSIITPVELVVRNTVKNIKHR